MATSPTAGVNQTLQLNTGVDTVNRRVMITMNFPVNQVSMDAEGAVALGVALIQNAAIVKAVQASPIWTPNGTPAGPGG